MPLQVLHTQPDQLVINAQLNRGEPEDEEDVDGGGGNGGSSLLPLLATGAWARRRIVSFVKTV